MEILKLCCNCQERLFVQYAFKNVFDLPKNHAFKNSDYLKNDVERSFCGIINIYNFLSDSYRYKRLNDEVYLIGRIFINKDNNFFVEEKNQLDFCSEIFLTKMLHLI